ncbi:MAG: CatB-related O-acetyltransferase [Halioglobus sp.]
MSAFETTANCSPDSVGEETAANGSSPELRRARSAGLLLRLYGVMQGFGAGKVRGLIRRLLSKLEGGEMQSATLREIMSRYYGVRIGAHSYGCFDAARFPRGTRVGRYVSVGPGVEVYRRNHPLDRLSLHPYFYNPKCGADALADVATPDLEICADAWLGARAIILPGCKRVGLGAVLAAGAVVTKDVPDYAIVAGNPAQIRRYRFTREAIAAAESSRWWFDAPDTVANRFDMTNNWCDSSDVLDGGQCHEH